METLRKYSGLFLFEGILLIVFGILAIVLPQFTTLVAELFVGILLIIAGGFRLFRSVKFRKEIDRFGLSIFASILSIAAGIYLLGNPIRGLLILTLIIGIYFFTNGLYQLYYSIGAKRSEKLWVFTLFSGITSIILSLIILSGLPGTAFWVIGLFIGIDFIVYGTSLISSALNIGYSGKRLGF